MSSVSASGTPVHQVQPGSLSAAAAVHLAHELSGGWHVILGHAELLAVDATTPEIHDSAAYIHEAAERLRGACDDVVDLFRLPVLPERGFVRLSLNALVESVAPAARRGEPVRTLEQFGGEPVIIDATVHRVPSCRSRRITRRHRVGARDAGAGAAADLTEREVLRVAVDFA
jgi:hypothetical protein